MNAELATQAGLSADGSSKVTAADYQQLVERIRELVRYTVPASATTVVVSRGDEQLLQLDGRPAWHFPSLPDGRYSGEYPADSAAAISHLNDLCAKGAGYLVLPSTAFWWLEFYDEFDRYLEEQCETVAANSDCRIYRLLEEGSYAADRRLVSAAHVPGMTRAESRILSHLLDSLLPVGAHSAVLTAATAQLPPGAESWQPPEAAVAEPGVVAQALSALAGRGVQYFVIPRGASDWLAAHPALTEVLDRDHRLVTSQRFVGEIYELSAASVVREQPPRPQPQPSEAEPAQPPRPRSLLERLGRRLGQFDGR
jgi:hypothetical protein